MKHIREMPFSIHASSALVPAEHMAESLARQTYKVNLKISATQAALMIADETFKGPLFPSAAPSWDRERWCQSRLGSQPCDRQSSCRHS